MQSLYLPIVVCAFYINKCLKVCFVIRHQVVWIKGHGHKRIIVLKNDMKGKGDGIFLLVCLIY